MSRVDASSTATDELVEIGPQPGPQKAFLACSADFALYGGAAFSGKSYATLLDAVNVTEFHPDVTVAIFRRTLREIRDQGGLWHTAMRIYPLLGARFNEVDHIFYWGARPKSGYSIKFSHLEHEKDKLSYQGAQITRMYFDELTHFTETQFSYLLTRLRSNIPGIRPYVRATCNPDPDSWVYDWVSWYLLPDGYPDPDKAGATRYYAMQNDHVTHGSTPEEVASQAGVKREQVRTFAFFPGTMDDNPAGREADPEYYDRSIANQPEYLRQQLGGGNWHARPAAGKVIKADRIAPLSELPKFDMTCTAWDFAHTEDGGAYTAMVRMGCWRQDGEAHLCILELWRGQVAAGTRDDMVVRMAEEHGRSNWVLIPQDAAAGKSVVAYLRPRLQAFPLKIMPTTASRGSKETKAQPFASSVERGLVKRRRDILFERDYLSELSGFPEAPYKDWVDASADAHTFLVEMGGRSVRGLEFY